MTDDRPRPYYIPAEPDELVYAPDDGLVTFDGGLLDGLVVGRDEYDEPAPPGHRYFPTGTRPPAPR